MFIDSHCHLDDPRLAPRLAEIVAAAAAAGVGGFVVPGVAPAGWPAISSLARGESGIVPAFGLHPQHAHLCTPVLLDQLADFLQHGAAVGEIGLDHTLADVPHPLQEEAFRAQLRLAGAHRLPVLIHCRRAFPDLLRVLREEKGSSVGGVMHAFSGSPEIARECIGLGFAIGVAGSVTYANAVRPVALVREIPLEHLLLETDAPDMTPEPHRGRPNEPLFLLDIARKVAEVKGITLTEVAEVTTRTARRLFRLD